MTARKPPFPLPSCALMASALWVAAFALQSPCRGNDETRLDLNEVRQEIVAYFETLLDKEGRYGSYRKRPGKRPDLYSSCDVAIMRFIMGEDLKESLTETQRKEWIAHINSFALRDGTYTDLLPGHSKLHANGTVIGALGVLGGRQPHPVSLYDDFDTPEEAVEWLENEIDWKNQWTSSHEFWGGLHMFSMSKQCSVEWRSAVFDWLDAHLDPATGWWKKGTPHADRHQPLGGGVHIYPIYQHHQRPFPLPKAVIDSALEMQLPDGAWADNPDWGHMTYLDLDALYALAYMQSLAPNYRRKDIRQAVSRYADVVIEKWPEYRKSLEDQHPHIYLAAVGTLGVLNQHLPERFPSDEPWKDIFSDIALSRTDLVETLERD